ncbi:GNAT family N-acetyltransferase [Streptomyces sp. NPDC020422]|uniref:GNAT family N-acetyltransferase n=1 Tax=Streptomyces sp. NPDC020422 TaxID=3365074 RepID=UPI0037BDD980
MVLLREVTTADWPLWRDARLAALADSPEAFKASLADWPHGGEERWRARLAAPGSYGVVALLDGRAVGMAAGLVVADGAHELRSVWVGPRARGRGVGDRLIAAVEAWAVRSGAGSLRLGVIPGNTPAIALYSRHGFTPAGRPGGLLPGGRTRELLMVKALGAGTA